MLAALAGNLHLVSILAPLEASVVVSSPSLSGPAAWYGALDAVSLLLGTEAKMVNRAGKTALMFVAARGRSTALDCCLNTKPA
jgi:ankyrin repeat protein